ncbi:Hsp33 family molecular chaperone HslO [Psychrobacter sp. I-STPA6b]|uniref:Hsp33 family molecular chaperone HslO n=1 Tax=Psychrobacter sp. I-STPA6b TaxID=2585718 RepID=UPI001D0C1E9D|nr:Hsp33 family molecular chaperone HslO [Psychrobacter sp. I-STPA6b]
MTQTQATHSPLPATNDLRQRFFVQNSPVRGDVVRLERSYGSIIAQKDYPEAIKRLLGEMLTASSLLIGTLKINGRLSIQLQSSDPDSLLNWAMAECDNTGIIRALASWKHETDAQADAWQQKTTANEAFAELGAVGQGVLFINIQPEKGEAYQGIVERGHDNLADCLAHYQYQSAQIPTLISLTCDGLQAGGILVQMLPQTAEEKRDAELNEGISEDDDLWSRLTMLTRTVKDSELTQETANEILYRLYHEEDVVVPEAVALQFGCTCSEEKCQTAIIQIGQAEALDICVEQGGIEMDCGFCGALYHFNQTQINALFADD